MAEQSRKVINTIILLFVLLIVFNIVIDPKGIFNNVLDSLSLWVFKVYPPIFIFYILSNLIISLKFFQEKINYLFKLFKFKSPRARMIFSMSLFLGNPATSALINENILQQNLDLEDGNNLLCISSFLNPLFIIAFLTDSFDDIKIIVLVLFVHIFSNFVLSFFVLRKSHPYTTKLTFENNHPNLVIEIFDSIERANFLLIKVCGIIVASNLCKYALQNILFLVNLQNNSTILLLSLIEVTSGLNDIKSLSLSFNTKLAIMCFLISFGGLSIHLQVYSIIFSSGLSFKKFFLFRFFQGLISYGLCILLLL